MDAMLPIAATASDIAQRALTWNKRQQRRDLARWVGEIAPPPGGHVLDFGCGTGLFASTLQRLGFAYTGFDPDEAAIRYARRLYPRARFVSTFAAAAAAGPFDLVLANCCFHHIPDDALRQETLPAIAEVMHAGSALLLIDVLPLEPDASLLRRAYNVLELGSRKRTPEEFDHALAALFAIRSRRVRRSFVLSLETAANPLYNDVIVYTATLRPRAVPPPEQRPDEAGREQVRE